MTAIELYELLDEAGIDFDVIEVFEGVRMISIKVEEEEVTEWSIKCNMSALNTICIGLK